MKEDHCYSCHLEKNHLKESKEYFEQVSGTGVILCTVCGCRVKYKRNTNGTHSMSYVSKK